MQLMSLLMRLVKCPLEFEAHEGGPEEASLQKEKLPAETSHSPQAHAHAEHSQEIP